MEDADARRRWGIERMRKEEIAAGNVRWVFLSFADETKFLGGVIVEALGVTHAIAQTKAGGYNPGGSVACFDIPEGALPPDEYRNRLLTREECKTLWPDAVA